MWLQQDDTIPMSTHVGITPPSSAPTKSDHASWFLSCVRGADRGANIALESHSHRSVFGRRNPCVTDPSISRDHFEIRWDDQCVYLRERSSTNGTRIRRKHGLFPRRLGSSWKALQAWDYVDAGHSRWQLRPRPQSLLLAQEKKKRTTLLRRGEQSLWSAGWRLLLPLMFIAFTSVRLLFWLASPWREIVLASIATAILFAWSVSVLRRDMQTWDGALLALHLEHCVALPLSDTHSSQASHSETMSPFPWEGAPRCSLWEAGSFPRCPGFYGPYALLMALWSTATHSRPWGGARIVNDSKTLQCGNGKKLLHIITSNRCAECGEEWKDGVGHVAIAPTQSELPSCCDAVFCSESSPVSHSWAQQVFTPIESTRTHEEALPTQVDAHSLWEQHHSEGKLSTIIGVDEHSQPVSVDIVKDGPHAVIVGTTGSGKSEALITLLAGLARNYSPASLRFVLIDYKGGASLSQLSHLPHTEVLLTDLSPSAALRTFEGLRALADRRASLLAQRGYASISDWEDKDPRTAPCRVVIVCDEFTTFAQTHADFFEDILRWTAQGRALGLHIVLATQRPDRALTPAVLANVDLRIALRCRESSASQLLIGSGQAATLPSVPGRGIIDSRGLFQCAWLPHVTREIDSIQQRWRRVSSPALWIRALPDTVHKSQLDQICDSAPSSNGTCFGIADGTRYNQHLPVLWRGGNIRCEGTTIDAETIQSSVHGIAYTLASTRGLPLVSVSEKHTHADLILSPSSAELVDFLGSWRDECVLEIGDFEEFQTGLDSLLGQVHARNLWAKFSQESTQAGISVVCGTTSPTTQWDKEGRFYSYRLLSTRSQHFLSQWGLSETRFQGHQGHWILAHAPIDCVPNEHHSHALLPLLVAPLTHDHPHEESSQGAIPQQWNFTPPTLDLPLNEDDIVITSRTDILTAGSSRTLHPNQWSHITQLPDTRLVIMSLTEDLKRALLPRAYHNDWLLRLRHLPENRALILSKGNARLVQIKAVNTLKEHPKDPNKSSM